MPVPVDLDLQYCMLRLLKLLSSALCDLGNFFNHFLYNYKGNSKCTKCLFQDINEKTFHFTNRLGNVKWKSVSNDSYVVFS